jgi:hypothetical protein
MPKNDVLESTDALITSWLSATDDSPAGPLYTGGKYAEADIVGAVVIITRGTCSSCTASRGGECC